MQYDAPIPSENDLMEFEQQVACRPFIEQATKIGPDILLQLLLTTTTTITTTQPATETSTHHYNAHLDLHGTSLHADQLVPDSLCSPSAHLHSHHIPQTATLLVEGNKVTSWSDRS
mmetsp:Transcript_41143/g.81134  ORF Transcript_41143/g.81134 Transcript_41143/m.81134 type:complete len:116 (-) Transcript_41143:819-1166(-)